MSKYLTAFRKLVEDHSGAFELVGNCCLVELIKDDDFKTKSGLVIASGLDRQVNGLHADKPTFVRILVVGQGMPDEDGKLVSYDVDPGDICLVGATSIKQFSVFGKLINYGETVLGLIDAETIQLRFKGEEGFNRCFDTLNSSIEAQMGKRG